MTAAGESGTARVPGWLRVANGLFGAAAATTALYLIRLLVRWHDGPEAIPVLLFAAFLTWYALATGLVAATGRPRFGTVSSAREVLWLGWFVTFVALKDRLAGYPHVDEVEAYGLAAVVAGAAWLAIRAIWRWYARGRAGTTRGSAA